MLLPFVGQDRFKSVKNFETRLNKALSTGTNTHQMLDESFLSFFKSNTLQPMRKSIIENSQILENYLHSLNSNIGLHFEKSENHAENKFHIFKMKLISRIKFIFGDPYRLCKLVYHYILQHDFNSLKNEREYYKTNIVDIYNNYKMLIVPEEIIGLPGIGFIEGMFCGSAYIGLRDPMYQDLGLIEGMHYIAYDGSLEDLISKISYYQENENELQRIAANGNDFVMKNFNQEKVAKDFFSNLYELASTNNLKHD